MYEILLISIILVASGIACQCPLGVFNNAYGIEVVYERGPNDHVHAFNFASGWLFAITSNWLRDNATTRVGHGDMNNDGKVNLKDFTLLSAHWPKRTEIEQAADFIKEKVLCEN